MQESKISSILSLIGKGFEEIEISDIYKESALKNIEQWLTDDKQFRDYQPQIEHLATAGYFKELLDAFYQVLPFGTSGRRGKVGIGCNRMNPWTVQASAQGHSTYLIKRHGEDAKTRGVVIAYDVRVSQDEDFYSDILPNPVKNITSKDLAYSSAEVYMANGIKCHIFEDIRSTPELSFAIIYLKAIAGVMMSASHNPKTDNGKKVYSDNGGQLLPPEDQNLVKVVNFVTEIQKIKIEDARSKGLLDDKVGKEVDDAYIQAILKQSILGDKIKKTNIKVVFSPLHGVGETSVFRALKAHGFDVVLDEKTSKPDGAFPNVKFNIPNPEVKEAMETLVEKGKEIGADMLVAVDPDADRIAFMAKIEEDQNLTEYAKEGERRVAYNADILLNSDPDADRIGIMAKTKNKNNETIYRYFHGNEISILLTHFIIDERDKLGTIPKDALVAKTAVTTELVSKIAQKYNVKIAGDLMVGFKYIANEIKKLEDKDIADNFLIGMEESHGYLVGSYARDKDAAGAALLLCELASKLKEEGKTIVDYLDDIYREFGYHEAVASSLVFLGAEGKEKINKITEVLRNDPPLRIGESKITNFVDHWSRGEFLSDTDKTSRNVLVFYVEPPENVEFIKITIRPSGTEPKIKIYCEVGSLPLEGVDSDFEKQVFRIRSVTTKAIDDFIDSVYKIVNIDMPRRGFRLSALLPVDIKLMYFDIEDQLIGLEKENLDPESLRSKVNELLKPFGKDPVEKINGAFKEKTGETLMDFLKKLGF